ncbi:UDP-glycosyltransferase 90A1 [Sesamum alatum]|uniref:Glycosyltransferase n=1 Tax=Sesamum alatum TaxID=300844 RepID=A0AAE1XUE4_9LAMI|nr:UDP-glycosyltransferase 90A1 [Sesamum alatum]
MASPSSPTSKHHIVLFPFMSKGHTIPLLHLARLLLDRGVRITIFTTPANHPFISQCLSGADVSITDLPFPENIPGIPHGAESTDKLPSMSLFIPFVNGIKLMKPSFEEALQNIHSQVSCIISDGFLHWTLESASRFGIPRLSFYGTNHYSMALASDAIVNGLLSLHESDDEPFTLAGFPWIKLTRNDFDSPLDKRDPRGPHLDFMSEVGTATANSYGLLVNSFCELEQPYEDYWNRECQPKAWSIGPLCLAQPSKLEVTPCHRPKWMHWLDQKLAHNCPVLYVAFGSQTKISPTQLREIAFGLEEAKVSFLWVMRESKAELRDGFEDKDSERGIIVNEWVDQREVLEHPIVQGFLSHCGWNSVLEGICAEVPILAWPMMAEQHLNARMVEEEIKIGFRVNTVDGSAKGFVTSKSLTYTVLELMEGEKGKTVREKVKEVAKAARKAMAEGGSSWHALNNILSETLKQTEINSSEFN